MFHIKHIHAKGIPQENPSKLLTELSITVIGPPIHVHKVIDEHPNNCPLKGLSLVHTLSNEDLGPFKAIMLWKNQVIRDVDTKDNNGWTLFSYVDAYGHEVVVKLLFDIIKADVDTESESGRMTLCWAALRGDKEVVKLLLSSNKVEVCANENGGRTPLSLAVENEQEAINMEYRQCNSEFASAPDASHGVDQVPKV